MRLVLVLALGAAYWGCWRGDPTVDAQRPSFVARVNAAAELQRRVDALAPRIVYARQRLIGLASEAERDSIRTDLAGLEREIAVLSRHVRERRARGDSSTALAIVEHDLGQAAVAVDELREDLVYAKTTAELAALAALAQKAATPVRFQGDIVTEPPDVREGGWLVPLTVEVARRHAALQRQITLGP